MADYRLFGWRIRSALALPTLAPWTRDDRPPDVTIDFGAVPPLPPPAMSFSPAIQIGDHTVRVEIPTVAAYRIEQGKRITVDPALSPEAPDVRLFLQGTVFSALCFQRNRLPLHASMIDVDGRVVVLTGESGAGKSTTAAALMRRGHTVLADDVCLLEIGDGGSPVIHAGIPQIRLWDEASRYLGIGTTGLEKTRATIEKFNLPIEADQQDQGPRTPALIVAMKFLEHPAPTTTCRLSQGHAMRMHPLVHRWRLGLAMGKRALFFHDLAALAKHCPVFSIERSRDFGALDTTIGTILDLLAGEGRDGRGP